MNTRNRTEKDFVLCIKCKNRFAKKDMHRVGSRLTESKYICSTCKDIYDNARSMQCMQKEIRSDKVWTEREKRKEYKNNRTNMHNMQTFFSED